jgi:hypothetical protein
MPNTAGFCASYKQELLQGVHAFGMTVLRATAAADTFKAALYTTAGNLNPTSTTVYTTDGEVVGTGYTAGGQTLVTANEPTLSGTKAYWSPGGSLIWEAATLANVNTLLLYNSSQAARAVGIYLMPTTSVVAGNLTVTLPAHAASTALIQLA